MDKNTESPFSTPSTMQEGFDRGYGLGADPPDGFCEQCGVNPVYGPGICGSCNADEDFYNCEHCHGTSCTGACDDEEDLT